METDDQPLTVPKSDLNSASPSPDIFPTATWGQMAAEFYRCEARSNVPAPVRAVVVFVRMEGSFVLADIAGRGWCTPSGRLETGETPGEAARRETWEEAGVTLGLLTRLGYYKLTNISSGETTYAPAYVADALELGPIPDGSESRGVRLVAPDELSGVYYTWDALIASVFQYALLSR